MKRYIFSFILLALVSGPMHAAQNVGGLVIDYAPAFRNDATTSAKWLGNVPDQVRQMVKSMDIFVAPPSSGLGEIRLVRIQYKPQVDVSIDGATDESIRRVSVLDGVKNFQSKVQPLSVSGREARRVTIEADRRGGKLGGEFLVVLDKTSNVLWQMQLIFGKKEPMNPFSKLSLNEEHSYAQKLLSSIRVDAK